MALHHKSGIPREFHPHCILQCLLFAGGPATQEKSANILKQMSDIESWIKHDIKQSTSMFLMDFFKMHLVLVLSCQFHRWSPSSRESPAPPRRCKSSEGRECPHRPQSHRICIGDALNHKAEVSRFGSKPNLVNSKAISLLWRISF